MRAVLALMIALAGCGDRPADVDAPVTPPDDAAPDAPRMIVDDGTPTRQPCTNTFGTAMTTTFGRLDGILVAIVPPGGGPCNADSDHVHLQVRASGQVYDVAITVASNGTDDVHSSTFEHALLGPAWAEGWHTGLPIDYPSLGLHAAMVPLKTKSQLASEIMSDLANANHVSIYFTGYGPGGGHLVHRNGNNHDGLVVTQPLSTPAQMRMFSFTDQTY